MWSAALIGDQPPVSRGAVHAALALLFIAVSYNFPLSIINAHVVGIGRGTLIAVETALMAAGLLLALTHWRIGMTRWLLMIGAFFALSLFLSLLRQGFEPKTFRDTLMFAVFIMVGMLVPRRDARRVFVVIHAVILLVMLLEIFFPVEYGALVDPRSYFINSRGFTAEQLNGDSNLFSASRPDERYLLPWLGWNRASSIFLEPLSLGNYVSFAAVAMLLFWSEWSPRTRLFMAAALVVILVGSDGRFAGISAIILILAAPLLRRAPAALAIAYLPLGVLAARLASQSFHWNPLNDDFPGRLARGMKQLFRLDWPDVLGFSVPTPALADSGIAYLVMAQSLVGVVMLQFFLYLQPDLRRPEQRLYIHATALTFTLSILVSISMLSIKTAGFYWFLMGVMIALPNQQEARRTLGPAGLDAASRRVRQPI